MFNKQNFCHVASNNRNEQKAGIFVYRTTDNLQTVTTSGYFNEKLVDINLHDLIIHEQTDNADKTKVVYNILCVTERTLDNVGTQTILTDWEKALVVPTKLSDLTGDVAIVNPTNGQQLVYNSTTQKWENAAGGSGLPDQTDNAGKFLTTNGTDASWGTTLTETLYLTGNNTQEKIIFNWGNNSSNNIICRATDYSLLFGYRNGGTFRQEFVFDWLYKSFYPINWQSSAIVTLGTNDYKWSNVYTKKINNGADIEVPNQAGTMVVADPTGATQGQVLTLDSNLTPAWADASSGSSYHPDLFDWKWADHICNDVQWLRADTFSWQAGSVYESAYQHLADDFTNGTRTLVPEGAGIWCYIAPDGHRIVDASDTTQVQNVIDLYNTTGVAWYYILDTTNERFKLPRTKFGVTGIRNGVGNYVEAGLPDLSGSVNVGMYGDPSGTGVFTGASAGYNWPLRGTFTQGYGGNVPFNASNGNSIYGNSDTVQPKATEMYLYFYVGEFTQAAIENTAGVVTEDFNELNAHKVIAFQAPTAQNNYTWYRKYADGWVEQGGLNHTISLNSNGYNNMIDLPITMADTNYSALAIFTGSYGGRTIGHVPSSSTTTQVCIGGYASQAGTSAINWQVSGMSAS